VLGHDERLAEALVEAPRDRRASARVLALVLADRHLVGAVGEHVGRLQHRVEEQPGGDELALRADLSRNWCMRLSSPSAVTATAASELGVLVHVGLAEEDAALGSRPAASRIAVVS
jgi:hypothetical protein